MWRSHDLDGWKKSLRPFWSMEANSLGEVVAEAAGMRLAKDGDPGSIGL